MITTAGIDIGSGAIKVAIFRSEDDTTEWVAKRTALIRQRDPFKLTAKIYDESLEDAGLSRDDIAYCATTGDGESIGYSTGHFYSMTTSRST